MEKVIIFIVGIYLVIMAVTDRRTKKIPVIPGIVCMALVALAQVVDGREWKSWIPGLLVGIFMYAVSRLSRGQVGTGDALVYFVTGLALGFMRNVELLMISLFLASIVALVLVVVRRVGKHYTLPFIPFTAVAFGVVVCL